MLVSCVARLRRAQPAAALQLAAQHGESDVPLSAFPRTAVLAAAAWTISDYRCRDGL